MPIEYVVMMVPFAAISVAYFAIWTNHRRKMMRTRSNVAEERAAQNAVKIEQLQKRIQIIERIVTDSGFDVSRKIEDLRIANETPSLNAAARPTPVLPSGEIWDDLTLSPNG